MGNYLFISDAAKEVKVESHVLRYWEEELHLPIKRNELGHRYYTEEDVERFKQIKGMKERGLQLKAIKMILKDGKLDVLPSAPMEDTEDMEMEEREEMEASAPENTGGLSIDIVPNKNGRQAVSQESREDKSRRLQWLLQQLIRQTLQENNGELCREIRESVVKELDYQFRMQEEREEARDRMLAERDEEHYKRMDELLRKKSRRLGKAKAEKEDAKTKTQERIPEEPMAKTEKKKRRFL
ncbi:MAG: MerR family transcriptional regulator [Lachnospiraceae bacterium]|uniref:helix-turn-helix domain-containing protein n=1 Tax=uncultured Acetatifactor sp. TaxID=1671927 RepID=UPI00260784FD|nr:helix-turn-helix domain-containing protein [uncultured Acetatifactor sp.]MCI8789331.1 MerR family transcriptional regulator [Lachnospiraceae bacterium]